MNGPIMIFITKDNIDTNIWEITDQQYSKKKSQDKLIKGTFIKVQILHKRVNHGDTQIRSIGKLVDIASPTEVTTYFGSVLKEETNDDSNFII